MKIVAKNGWHAKPLEEIATFSSGLWKGKKEPFRMAKVLRNTNFRPHGAISFDDVAEIDVECKQFEKRRLRSGDIILERSGGGPKQPVGRVVLFELDDENYSFSNFTSTIRVIDRSRLDPKFLHQVLNYWHSAGWTEKIQSRSTGIRNLDFKAYKQFLVPLPPMEEQRQIVAILGETFKGLDRVKIHADSYIEDLHHLRQSINKCALAGEYLEDAMLESWQRLALGECFKTSTGTTPSKKNKAYYGNHIPFVKPPDLLGGEISHASDGLSKLGKSVGRVAPKGSVLVSCIGNLGKAGLATTPVAYNQQINAILPNLSLALPEFILLQVLSDTFRQHLETLAGGTTIPIVNKAKFNSIEISIPPLDEQKKIVAILDEAFAGLDLIVAHTEAKLTDLEDLRQSLLQRAFAGELT